MKFLSKNCVTAAIIKTKYNLVGENFVSCGECNYFEKRLEKRLKEKNISVIITSQLDIDYFCLNKVNNVIYAEDPTILDFIIANYSTDEIYYILNDENFLLEVLIDYKKIELDNLKSKLNYDSKKGIQKQLNKSN